MTDNIKERIEDKIIDLISLGAGGRLVVFKPEKLDPLRSEASRDLIVEKRNDYKKNVISLNVYEKEFSSSLNKEIIPEEDFYLLFVNFDIVKQDIDDNFVVVPSNNLQTKFPMTKKSFVGFLIEKLK